MLNASSARDIDTAFRTLIERRVAGLLVAADAFFNSRREQWCALAAYHAIPAIYEWREYAFAGGLMTYGSSITDAYRGWYLYRSNPEGRKAKRSTGCAADQVRVRHQSTDRQSARPP